MLILRKEFAEKYPKGKYDSKKFLDFIKKHTEDLDKDFCKLLPSEGLGVIDISDQINTQTITLKQN